MADEVVPPTLQELLGYPPDARLLLINFDDAGMCHAVNQALTPVFSAGLVQSCTVMVPSPWFPEFVALKRENPRIHCGVHLTVTSEWKNYRWGPVAGADRVPSLVDDDGYFHASEFEFLRRADRREVEIEFRAQIERALRYDLAPTHVDSHMGAYHLDEDNFQVARSLAEEYGLTMRIVYPPRKEALRRLGWAVVDRVVFDSYEIPLGQREEFYRENLRRLEPGVTELLIHCAVDSAELRAICRSTWSHRVFDFDFFTSPATKRFLADEGIVCIGYHQLQQLHRQRVEKSQETTADSIREGGRT
jgi:hypothetical protein